MLKYINHISAKRILIQRLKYIITPNPPIFTPIPDIYSQSKRKFSWWAAERFAPFVKEATAQKYILTTKTFGHLQRKGIGYITQVDISEFVDLNYDSLCHNEHLLFECIRELPTKGASIKGLQLMYKKLLLKGRIIYIYIIDFLEKEILNSQNNVIEDYELEWEDINPGGVLPLTKSEMKKIHPFDNVSYYQAPNINLLKYLSPTQVMVTHLPKPFDLRKIRKLCLLAGTIDNIQVKNDLSGNIYIYIYNN